MSNECDHKATEGQAMAQNRVEVPQKNIALNMYYTLCVSVVAEGSGLLEYDAVSLDECFLKFQNFKILGSN